MQVVESTRSAKSHNLNERSSRSHCIVSLNVTKKSKSGKDLITSKFSFVDLAGSERIKKSGSDKHRGEEAKNINQSLTTLGRVITALRSSSSNNINKNAFVPFRESALTMLMKDSLSGNCRTCLIVTVADESEMTNESISSMQFGMSCGRISTTTSVNVRDLENDTRNLKDRLNSVDNEINLMKSRGMHG